MQKITVVLLLITLLASTLMADEVKEYIEQDWGLGVTMRTATIPFATSERTVASFVPLMFYKGERFFLRGIEGGYRFYTSDLWQISAMGRLRFFDIPKDIQNEVQGNNILWGGKVRYKPIRFSTH